MQTSAHITLLPNMQAMRWHGARNPLSLEELPVPRPQEHQVLLRVRACGVCRTDLHLLDGELPSARYPVTPGHEVVGEVVEAGRAATRFRLGERIGVPWLARTCGTCRYCRAERENLCEQATFTGHTVDGGYAEYAVADERYCHPIPAHYSDAEAAPLLCAGLIGYCAYRAARGGVNLGLRRRTGFCTQPGRRVGRRLRSRSARAPRCGNSVRTGGRAYPHRAGCDTQGWLRRLRRHPHERDSGLPLSIAVG